MNLTTLIDLPQELIFQIALYSDRRTQYTMYYTCHYLRNSLNRLESIFNQIDSVKDQRMKIILKHSGWTFLLKRGLVTHIKSAENLNIDFQFTMAPLSSRCYSFKVDDSFNLVALKEFLNENLFHFLEFNINTSNSLIWSILGETRTEKLSITQQDTYTFIPRDIIHNNFQLFASTSRVVDLEIIDYHFASSFFRFGHLLKNLETVKIPDYHDTDINLSEFRKRCPNIKCIVCDVLYDKIIKIDWQMDEMEVFLHSRNSRYYRDKPPTRNLKKLTIIQYDSIDYYYDLTPVRDSLTSLKISSNKFVNAPFISDFLQNNEILKELELDSYYDNEYLDLTPFNLNLNRFSISQNFRNNRKLITKFLRTQHNLNEFHITKPDQCFNREVLDLIGSLKNNINLRSIEISTIEYRGDKFDIDSDTLKRIIQVFEEFKGRDLMINGVPIDAILSDVNPILFDNWLNPFTDLNN